MLRRYEIYSVDPAAPREAVAAMATAMKDCARYIPEMLHSAIGHAKSDTSLNFVWEHAYESPESYQRYMAHPFHAAILDRYLMNDSPDRIIVDDDHGLGLAGYRCDGPADFLLPAGAVRRFVALRLKPGSDARFAEIAKAEAARAGMIGSTFSDNYFGWRWFDGENTTGPEPFVTNIWEQGFATMADALAYDPQWRAQAGDIVESAVELVYEIEAGEGYGA